MGTSKARCRMIRTDCLPCPIHGLKEFISDNLLLWPRPLIQVLDSIKGKMFLLSLKLNLPLAQSNLHTTEARVEVAHSEPPMIASVYWVSY